MLLKLQSKTIPGTIIEKTSIGNTTGLEFLDKVFCIQDGILLSNIRAISGIEGSTLQNWVKRGWTANTVKKRYSKDQLSRILLINIMRDSLTLEQIDSVLHFINGDLDRTDDDIIPESQLFDMVCRIVESDSEVVYDAKRLHTQVLRTTSNFTNLTEEERARLNIVLEIICTAYFASEFTKLTNLQFMKIGE